MSRFRSTVNADHGLTAKSIAKPGLDTSLDKLTFTLRDFNSHLSHVDSTLDRMEGGFRNVSQFCQQLSQSANPLLEDGGDDLAPEQTTLSDSSCSGRSFECSYHSDVMLPYNADSRASSPSSPVGTVSNQSSVWCSSPSLDENDEYRKRGVGQFIPTAPTKKTFATTGSRSAYNPVSSERHTSDVSPRHSGHSSENSHSQQSLHSPSFERSEEIPEYINHKVTPGRYKTRQHNTSATIREWEQRILGHSQSASTLPNQNSVKSQALYGHKSYPRRADLLRHDSDDKSSSGNSVDADNPPVSSPSTHHNRRQQSIRSPSRLPAESEEIVVTLENLLRLGEESKVWRMLSRLLDSPERHAEVNSILAFLSGHAASVYEARNHGGSRDSLLQLAASALDASGQYSSSQLGPTLVGQPQTPRKPCGSTCTLSNPYAIVNNSSSCLSLSPRNRPQGSGSLYQLPGADTSVLQVALTPIPWFPDTMSEDARLPTVKRHRHPGAPNRSKSVILPMPDVMQRLDVEALQATDLTAVTSFTQLVSRLTGTLSDEIRIFRTLFVWTVALRLHCYRFDQTAPPESFVGLLRRAQTGQVTRNEILRRLCRYASIECRLVTGYSKQASDYRPKSSCGLLYTSWLAVHVADGWRFANADFAVRPLARSGNYVDVEGSVDCPTEFRCDEFYFLTDPEEHIFECFPDQKTLQLLRKSVNFQFFLNLPLLKSAFFNAGLALKEKYSASLLTSNGQVVVKLSMPRFVGISCSLENASDHSVLRGLCLVEVMPSGDWVRVEAAPSQPGKYYLHIFVSPDWRAEDQRDLACSFQINCSEHNYSRLVVTGRLPEVGFLGPTPHAKTLGIGMLSEGIARAGRPFLAFSSLHTVRIPFAVATGLKVCHQLKSFDRPGHQMVDCDSYALLQMQSRRGLSSLRPGSSGLPAYYQLRMPADGFYYLTVYASAGLSDSDHLQCVYRLLVSAAGRCRSRGTSLPMPFPRQTLWWVHCRLVEPASQRLPVGREHRFELEAPLADALAVVVNQTDWHFLSADGRGRWLGRVHVGTVLGSLSLFARLPSSTRCLVDEQLPPDAAAAAADTSDEAFVKLLDYVLVGPDLGAE